MDNYLVGLLIEKSMGYNAINSGQKNKKLGIKSIKIKKKKGVKF